jgi:hypothetical protein
VNWNSLVVTSMMILGESVYEKNVVSSNSFKKLASAMTNLNPDMVWEQDDVLFMLRLVSCCAASERQEILQKIHCTSKMEKSPAFMLNLAQVNKFKSLLRSSIVEKLS